MANVSKLIFSAAIAAASIASPALAAHEGTIAAHHSGYVAQAAVSPSLPTSLLNQTTGTKPFTRLAREGSLWEGGGP
jgi:hypothetical protein